MTYHLLCLPFLGYMPFERLEETLAYLQAIEDQDDNVRAAVAEVRKYIGVHRNMHLIKELSMNDKPKLHLCSIPNEMDDNAIADKLSMFYEHITGKKARAMLKALREQEAKE